MGEWEEIACHPVVICSFYLHGKAIKLIVSELNKSHLAGVQSKRLCGQHCFLTHIQAGTARHWSGLCLGQVIYSPIFYFTHMKKRLLT